MVAQTSRKSLLPLMIGRIPRKRLSESLRDACHDGPQIWSVALLDVARNQVIEGEESRTKDHHQQRRQEESKWVRCIEFPRLGKEGLQSFAIGSDVCDRHIHDQGDRNQSRRESQQKEDSAEALQGGDEPGIENREGNSQVDKEANGFRYILQFSPTRLPELPSPIKPHEKQEWRLQIIQESDESAIQRAAGIGQAHRSG